MAKTEALPKGPIIGLNFKHSGAGEEIADFVDGVAREKNLLEGKAVIVFPVLTEVGLASLLISRAQLPIEVGTQIVDTRIFEPLPEGLDPIKNTGHLSPEHLKSSTTWALIGHSEARKREKAKIVLGLTAQGIDVEDPKVKEEIEENVNRGIAGQIEVAQEAAIKTLVCFEDVEQARKLKELIGDYVGIVAYEPTWAIGTGKAATPEHANEIAKEIKAIFPSVKVLYGGSVEGGEKTNIDGFIQQKEIDGVLVGNKTLGSGFTLDLLRDIHPKA